MLQFSRPPPRSISGSLGEELDEDDRRTDDDVSSLSDEAEPEALKSSVSVEEHLIDENAVEMLRIDVAAQSDKVYPISERHSSQRDGKYERERDVGA